MAKRKTPPPELDQTIVHPPPDTKANEGKRGKPPPTWNPAGKDRQEPEE